MLIWLLSILNTIHLSGWIGERVDVNNFFDDKFYDMLHKK